jgi:hypothetical protein
MINRAITSGLVGAAVFAFPASAGISSVSSSGPGGTTPILNVTTTADPLDTLFFSADFTAAAPIKLSITLGGDSTLGYFVDPTDVSIPNIMNDSGVSFPSFYVYLVGAADARIYSAFYDAGTFDAVPTFLPDLGHAHEVIFGGPPGLGSGDATGIGISFSFSTPPPMQTVEVILSPTPVLVPEPSTWGLMAAGFGSMALMRFARARNRRLVG